MYLALVRSSYLFRMAIPDYGLLIVKKPIDLV
jgi:hypothetical protein